MGVHRASTKKDFIAEYLRLKKVLKKKPEDSVVQAEFLKHSKLAYSRLQFLFGKSSIWIKEGEAAYLKSLPKTERAVLNEKLRKYDPDATKEDCITDLRKVQEAFPLKYVSRTFYRNEGIYSESVWNKFFGTFLEFRRQAGLELNRHQHAAERGIAKHAAHDHYSEFYTTQVLPYYNKYEKNITYDGIKTMMIMSDLHDEECDEFFLEVFVDTCRRKQPDIIVLNGDIFDLYEFSRFSIDPRNVKIKQRFEFVWTRVFKALRDACPDAQIDFIMGNHEFRLIRLIADASPYLKVWLSDVMGITFSKAFGLDEFKINWVSKADFSAFTKKDVEDELKKNHKIYFNCYAVSHHPDANLMKAFSGTNGHHHRAAYTSTTNALLGATSWVQTPAGHVKDAEYLEGFPVWDLGFLEVSINVSKKQVVQKIHQVHDEWSLIDGVLYEKQK